MVPLSPPFGAVVSIEDAALYWLVLVGSATLTTAVLAPVIIPGWRTRQSWPVRLAGLAMAAIITIVAGYIAVVCLGQAYDYNPPFTIGFPIFTMALAAFRWKTKFYWPWSVK